MSCFSTGAPLIQVTVSNDYYVKVHWVGGAIGKDGITSPGLFAITGGSSLIKIPTYLAVSPNNRGVRNVEHGVDPFLACWKPSNGLFVESDGSLVQDHYANPVVKPRA